MKGEKKIAFHTLGCKLNFSETSSISRKALSEGYTHVGFPGPADIYVINSCTVTKNAEKRCKSLIRQALKHNPDASIAVVGCFSQINPAELAAIPGVSLVLGNADKFNLFDHIKVLEQKQNADPSSSRPAARLATDQPTHFVSSWSEGDRTRSFFKIQDGCDYFCSYCTIPIARGHSRSDSIAGTLKIASEIAKTNIKEIVLSGVNIGDFGKLHGETFFDFLKALVKIEGPERIRISSVEPDLLHNQIIELVADQPKLMPHFHIPLQSGSDEVLKAMGRKYNTSLFAHRVEKIHSLMPHACIAADLIVGFPAETDALFETSFHFLKDIGISYIHVFTYSERENTRAYQATNQVPLQQRKHRSKRVQELSVQKKFAFYNANRGLKTNVLWEKETHQGHMYGFTENYIKTKTLVRTDLINEITVVQLNILDNDGVYLI
jgi:threonylcarbamoyladenosine tRNA methylthiotransferase MtaB